MSDDQMRATAGSWWKEPQPTICPNSDCVRLGAELAQARQQIDELKRAGRIAQERAESAELELRKLEQQLAGARAERDEAMHHLAVEMAKNNSLEPK